MRLLKILTMSALFLLLVATAGFASDSKLTFDHYYDGPAVMDALETLNKAFPNLTKLESIGKSEEGRDIWLFTINNPKTGSDLEKPGIYVDGTIHGNEVQATEVCLYLASYMLNNYGTNEKITKIIDTKAFYIIPVVNVDSRWRFFTEPGGYGIGRSAIVPYDDDNDGRADEDPPEDIDGDGEILRMRIRDPFGGWKTHPDDPRVMVRTKPWEKGEWRRLGSEGIDNDDDGEINEDGIGYLDMNRNYGFKWQPPYVQSGSGDFPMSANPNNAIANFVITKPNITFNFAFHNMGGLIVRGPGSKLAGMYPQSDIKVYDYFGKEGEKIIPGYKYIIGGQDMYTTHGDFDEFMFSNLGIFGFVGELFMSEQEKYSKPKKDGDDDEEVDWFGDTEEIEKQKFNDHVNQGAMFTEWKKFDHPQLGEIEIGGWRTFTTRIPPTFLIQEMVHRNASLVIFTAEHAPDIELSLIDVKDIGDGLKRVRVRAYNPHALPTLSSNALRKSIYRKDVFSIKGNGLEVVSGGIVNDLVFDRVSNIEHRPDKIFTSIGSFGTREVQWIVKGKGKITINYDAVKAKNKSITIDI